MFQRGDSFATQTLAAALRSWEGTPHVAGQRAPGRRGGVDCVNFVVAVLEECELLLHPAHERPDVGPMPRPPQDLGVHTAPGPGADEPRGWSEVIGWMLRRFRSRTILSDPMALVAERRAGRLAQPGDVLVFAPSATAAPERVNHVGLCGDEPGSVWHASAVGRAGVTRGSLGDPALCALVRMIYRPLAPPAPPDLRGATMRGGTES